LGFNTGLEASAACFRNQRSLTWFGNGLQHWPVALLLSHSRVMLNLLPG